MLMEALKPWINYDHEGVVEPGQRFQAHGHRATELELAGLAVPVLDDNEKIKVVADPPPLQSLAETARMSVPPPEAKQQPPPPVPPQPKAKPNHDPKPVNHGPKPVGKRRR
jgi:hypothetical protein